MTNASNLLIRADSDAKIGTGHIMRCIALAEEWQAQGGHVTFLSHCKSKQLRQRLVSSGFSVIDLKSSHPDSGDIDNTLSCIQSMTDPWLILDGYHFDGAYQQTIREAPCQVLVVDDYAHQTEYHADLILNQNINGSRMRYSADIDTEFLMGPEYVLLRSQFLPFRNRDRQIAVHVSRILVTMGGADPDNVTVLVIEALQQVQIPNLEIRVVVGPANHNMESVHQAAKKSPRKIKVLHDVTNMLDLMAWADLAVAGGGTTWSELAFMGLPSLLLVLADNQVDVATGMTNSGASINLGEAAKASAHQITESIESLSADSKLRLSMSENARQLVDGIGVERVIKAIGLQRQVV